MTPYYRLLDYIHSGKNSLALFRKPDESGSELIIGRNFRHFRFPEDLKEIDKKGFFFVPFNTGNEDALFIDADEYYRDDELSNFLQSLPDSKGQWSLNKVNKAENSNQKDFIELVNNMKQEIAAGRFKKAVASRIRTEDRLSAPDPFLLFERLCTQYPGAFVYLFYQPGISLWMGASPELLMHLAHSKVSTVSLAGSQPYYQNMSKYEWGAKEKDEQKIVTDYIHETLEAAHCTSIRIEGPNSVQAGNLVHLKCEIEAKLPDEKAWPALLQALHPTPAVCGFPKQAAIEFILHHEKHERHYYCGFLGPWYGEGKGSLFVNLRCMQITKQQLIYYAGCGITAGSDAQAEWMETEVKTQTLSRVVAQLKNA